MASATPHHATDAAPAGRLAMAISNRVVQIISEYTGRGPTKSRVYMNGDIVVCVFSDSLTKGERKLVDNGEGDSVLQTRRTYQSLMRGEVTRAVEDLTGRRSIAFFSDNHVDPDMGIEVVVLEPLASDNGADGDGRLG
jgi:uncharacterized protein YbcI